MTSETKRCQNCKQDFTIDPDDFTFYEKMQVPPPTFCWLCRAQRRMAFRNERSLFKRKSDFSGKDIFSAFAPDAPVKVYEKEVWLTDQWDPMAYGREYDFERPFFEQFKELLHAVPLKNLNVVNGTNSDYCNNFTDPKNCYLVFNGNYSEDCAYGNGFTNSKQCQDTSHVAKCERCFQSFWLTACHKVIYSAQCESSFDLAFCRDCVGCNNCFLSAGLRNKSYCILNKPYPKEEYQKKIAEYDLGSHKTVEELKKKAREFWATVPLKYIEGFQNTDVSGNYIDHCKNVRQSFLVRESQNIRYSQNVQELPGSRDVYDYTAWGDSNELVYECTACGIGTHNIKFCYNVQENARDIEYSYMCAGSSDLFGCVGLRKKQFCVFNRQYSKEDYAGLVERIKAQMDSMPYTDAKRRIYKYGEYFPAELSPFAYNETLGQEYFPLTKEQALAAGFSWRDGAERSHKATLAASNLPDGIKEITDSILKESIGCAHAVPSEATGEGQGEKCNDNCTIAFRLTPDELEFYRAMNVPIPRLCPNCRHYERIAQRSKLNIYTRSCQCAGKKSDNGSHNNSTAHFHGERPCPNSFETNYSPDKPDIIYCEQCYQAEAM